MDTYKLFKELLEKGQTKEDIIKALNDAENAVKADEVRKEAETQKKLKVERAKKNLAYAVEAYLNAIDSDADKASNKEKAVKMTESFIEDLILNKTEKSKTSYYIGGKRASKDEFDRYISNLCKYFY